MLLRKFARSVQLIAFANPINPFCGLLSFVSSSQWVMVMIMMIMMVVMLMLMLMLVVVVMVMIAGLSNARELRQLTILEIERRRKGFEVKYGRMEGLIGNRFGK